MGEPVISLDVIPSDRYAVTHVVEQSPHSLSVYGHDGEGTNVFIKAKAIDHRSPDARLRLEREADMLGSFNHPQIPQLLDVELDGVTPYIITEFKPGTQYVKNWLKKYPAVRLAAKLCLSALEPLQYVHDMGITHRDVKTKNLLMQWSGDTSLLDFELGLCGDDQTAEAVYLNASCTDASITDVGHVRGTADYIAPERAFGFSGNPRSDIYSMGIVFYELLFGKLPFVGDSAPEVIKKHCREEIDLSRTARADRYIPNTLLDIVERATQKTDVDRYESASEMGDDIARYLQTSQA